MDELLPCPKHIKRLYSEKTSGIVRTLVTFESALHLAYLRGKQEGEANPRPSKRVSEDEVKKAIRRSSAWLSCLYDRDLQEDQKNEALDGLAKSILALYEDKPVKKG